MNDLNIIVGDCREEMAKLPEQSVQCVVTSPPYWGQRDYGTADFIGGNDPECDHIAPVNRRAAGFNKRYHGKEFATDKQGETPGAYTGKCGKCGAVRSSAGIGLEPDVHEWIDSMVEVFRGVWRVLRDDGTVWLNLGDKYAGSGGASAASQRFRVPDSKSKQASNHGARSTPEVTVDGLKQKDLIGLPWRMAFALQADGWYLRRDIIWHKPNPMPESATDRPSTAHEYIFLLTKQPHYFYDSDAVKNPVKQDWGTRNRTDGKYHNEGSGLTPHSGLEKSYTTGNMRSVWKIATQPFGGAHYATYPEKLVEPCIKAGSSERGECPACGAPWERVVHQERIRERTPSDNHAVGNFQSVSDVGNRKTAPLTLGWQPTCDHKREPIPQTVLDPFSGAGTTGLVAMKLGRSYTGIELNPEYAAMSRKRIVERVGATSPDALKPDEQAQGRLI